MLCKNKIANCYCFIEDINLTTYDKTFIKRIPNSVRMFYFQVFCPFFIWVVCLIIEV